MAKNLKVSDAEKAEIEKLFKAGMDAAAKDPKKFWAAQRDSDSRLKPYGKLSALPMVALPSKKKGAKRESVAERMDNLLADLNKGK
jgi:hypothetical protein